MCQFWILFGTIHTNILRRQKKIYVDICVRLIDRTINHLSETMLSFFRTKSSEASLDKIINGTKNIGLDVDKTSIDPIASMESTPIQFDNDPKNLLKSLGYQDEMQLRGTIFGRLNLISICTNTFYVFLLFDMISMWFPGMLRTIRDPEKPTTLEELKVVYEDGIFIQPPTSDNVQVVC